MKRMNSRKAVTGVALVALTLAGITACNSPQRAPTPRSAELNARPPIVDTVAVPADALLAARVFAALKTDSLTRGAQIQVSVIGGRARLSGFVANAAAKLRAGELARRADGVTAVENRLILRYQAALSDPLGNVRVHL